MLAYRLTHHEVVTMTLEGFASYYDCCRYKLDSKDHWEEHADKTVDDRMADALKKRNLDPFSDSRPLEPEDFQKFDYIIGMNEQNFQEVEKAALYWKDTLNKPIPGNWRDKVAGCYFHCRAGCI